MLDTLTPMLTSEMALEAVRADPATLTAVLINLAISAVLTVAALLLTPKPKSSGQQADEQPPTLSNRGSFIPLVLGRRRVAPVVGWLGNRKRSKSSSTGVFTYREDGWHMLCVGPAYKLYTIYMNGKVIFPVKNQTVIDSGGTPSGTDIFTSKSIGNPRIYWGESDQPVDSVPPYVEPPEPEPVPADPVPADEEGPEVGDPENTDIFPWQPPVEEVDPSTLPSADPGLAENTGILSRWPFICYVYWNRVKMQGSPLWPNMEYEIEVRLHKTLDESSAWLDDGTTSGVNPAHALWQVLTDAYPHGCGIPEAEINKADLEAIGLICEEEHIPMNILAADGQEAADMIGNVLQAAGVMLYQVSDLLRSAAIREVDVPNVPVLDDTNLSTQYFEIESAHGERNLDRVIYSFPDEEQNYRDTTVQMDDDSQASANAVVRQETVRLSTVTQYAVAERIAQRRQQEDLTSARKYTLPIARGGRNFYPGMPFIADGKLLRVITFHKSDETSEVEVEALEDFYSVALPSQVLGSPAAPDPVGDDDIGADIAATWLELPNDLSTTRAIAALRLRSDSSADSANVWGSLDGVDYTLLGTQATPAAGGRLLDNFPISTATILEYGPRFFAPFTEDLIDTLDLSSSPNSWRSGYQLAFIGEEIFWVSEVVGIGGSQYQLKGVIRARYDTDKHAHSVGDYVYIISRENLARIPAVGLPLSSDYYVKIQPTTPTLEKDLSEVTAVVKDGGVRFLNAMPVENLAANWDLLNLTTNTYLSTDTSISFTWDYRVVDGLGQAAGESPAGTPVPDTSPTVEYGYQIVVKNAAGTVVRSQTVTTTSFVYSMATLTADFGSAPPSFSVEVTAIYGGLPARYTRSITVRIRT